MIRSFFTVSGIVCVLAVFFFFIRPDWIKQMSSSPAQVKGMTYQVHARLAADRLMAREAPKDLGGYLQIDSLPSGEDAALKVVEDVGDDLPSRNMSYLLVVNKANNTMRYCRLSPNVKKFSIRGNLPPDVKFQEVNGSTAGMYQAIIWISAAVELQLDIELMVPTPSRS